MELEKIIPSEVTGAPKTNAARSLPRRQMLRVLCHMSILALYLETCVLNLKVHVEAVELERDGGCLKRRW